MTICTLLIRNLPLLELGERMAGEQLLPKSKMGCCGQNTAQVRRPKLEPTARKSGGRGLKVGLKERLYKVTAANCLRLPLSKLESNGSFGG